MKRYLGIMLALVLMLSALFGCSSHEHVYDTLEAVKPDCSRSGLSEGKYCSECGKILVEQKEIARLEHIPGEWVIKTEPTCVSEGEKVRFCLMCAEVLERETVGIGAHDFSAAQSLYEYSCIHCGALLDLRALLEKKSNEINIAGKDALTGNFLFLCGEGMSSSDEEISKLINGYSLLEKDSEGRYVWNEVAVLSHSSYAEENGDLTIFVKIREGLRFSDGSPVRAENYLAYLLASSSSVAEDEAMGEMLCGFEDFKRYNGSSVSGNGCFSGVRLLGDYSFSLTFDSSRGYYPYYYFSDSYLVLTPYDIEAVLGEGSRIKDDGEGAYIAGDWYQKGAEHLASLSLRAEEYPTAGPYMIESYDRDASLVVLKKNEKFAGNYEGRRPNIERINYGIADVDTQMSLLTAGVLDIVSDINSTENKFKALITEKYSDDIFEIEDYSRAGYGFLRFHCDLGPVMFDEVRKAVAGFADMVNFSREHNHGMASAIYGPYVPESEPWLACSADIELEAYEYSLSEIEELLAEGGWIYNSEGGEYVKGRDTVRYKRLSAKESTAANINYCSAGMIGGVNYKTLRIGNEYYMPLVINWYATQESSMTPIIAERLGKCSEAGMLICAEYGELDSAIGLMSRDPYSGYTSASVYNMFNMASEFSDGNFDFSWEFTSDPRYFDNYSKNYIVDEYDLAFPYYGENGHKLLSYEDAYKASGGRLGLDYISMAMVYDSKTEAEYNKWWKAFIERWNQLLPDITLYCDMYYDICNSAILNYGRGAFIDRATAILYASLEIEG